MPLVVHDVEARQRDLMCDLKGTEASYSLEQQNQLRNKGININIDAVTHIIINVICDTTK